MQIPPEIQKQKEHLADTILRYANMGRPFTYGGIQYSIRPLMSVPRISSANLKVADSAERLKEQTCTGYPVSAGDPMRRPVIYAEITESTPAEPEILQGTEVIGRPLWLDNSIVEVVELPYTVTYLTLCAFCNCDRLRVLDMRKTRITYIDTSLCLGCRSLEYVYLPHTAEEIGEDAFLQCSHLRAVYFPRNRDIAGTDKAFGTAYDVSEIRRYYAP